MTGPGLNRRINPFSSRFVEPGALPFVFPDGEGPRTVIGRLMAHGWRGSIIGPHGTGKSTLVASVLPEVRAAGREPCLVILRQHAAHLPDLWGAELGLGPADLLVIDGFEQLSWARRCVIRAFSRTRGCGLLVTAHRPIGLPVLFRTEVTPELAVRLVADLLHEEEPSMRLRREIRRSLSRHRGNLRETLFELYDHHERGRLSRTRPCRNP